MGPGNVLFLASRPGDCDTPRCWEAMSYAFALVYQPTPEQVALTVLPPPCGCSLLLVNRSSSTPVSTTSFSLGTLSLVWFLPVKEGMETSFVLQKLFFWLLINDRVNKFLHLVYSMPSTTYSRTVSH